MSANYLARGGFAFGLSAWVVLVFFVAQVIVALLFFALDAIFPVIGTLNPAILASVSSAVVYGIAIVALVAMPAVVKLKKVTRETFGLQRLVSWSDMGIGLLALLPYFIISALLTFLIGLVWSGFDPNQEQAIPFTDLTQRYELVVAFVTLVVLAPFAEEALFRGYLLGRMKEKIRPWMAVVVTAVVFGALHLPGEVVNGTLTLQWAVAADTLALGLILGSLRIFTGSIWAGILLHMAKNVIAFYFLFIYPTMPGTL